MIADSTKAAVLALLAVDPQATDAEKERVKLSLVGGRQKGAVIRIKQAAETLGVCRASVIRYVNNGRLEGVRGGGDRLIGVTQSSLAAF